MHISLTISVCVNDESEAAKGQHTGPGSQSCPDVGPRRVQPESETELGTSPQTVHAGQADSEQIHRSRVGDPSHRKEDGSSGRVLNRRTEMASERNSAVECALTVAATAFDNTDLTIRIYRMLTVRTGLLARLLQLPVGCFS